MGELPEGAEFLFPAALQGSRLRRSLKQEALAEMLAVPLRTLVSWETGTRTPPVATVVRLSKLLGADLLHPYIHDDLIRRYGVEALADLPDALPLAGEGAATPPSRPEPTPLTTDPAGTVSEDMLLQHLFQILDIFKTRPDLIAVTLDFLHSLTADSIDAGNMT